jgi:hypothetical protein
MLKLTQHCRQPGAAAESHPKRQSSASGKTPKKLRFTIQFGRVEIDHSYAATPKELRRFKSRRHPEQPANLGKSQQPFILPVNRQILLDVPGQISPRPLQRRLDIVGQ